eukprot:CAMPEP_0116028630 /NCGR_PEP_ID=MMETSP0321-20121206/15555_1 /TAXON_ID=163516 /ORGANISM="Leptocylindrus danicus var. danicus, Strain B650" /LENGTH=48 /DNA_ID= /DNA_START= /DNA_END= /DNA_ORIENTATION=
MTEESRPPPQWCTKIKRASLTSNEENASKSAQKSPKWQFLHLQSTPHD